MDKLLKINDFITVNHLLRPFIIAIDGHCAAGKTTLAERLRVESDFNIIHVDDFYLPFCLRTEETMKVAGANINRRRLLDEALIPLNEGNSTVYRKYDCHKDTYFDEVYLDSKKCTVVEGSYSCHPELAGFYSLKIFMDISVEEQQKRISQRNPSSLKAFNDMWIPRENEYFRLFGIKEHSDLIFESN